MTEPGDLPDPLLVRQAREGSDEAFRRLVERHMPAVLTVARSKVGRGTLAEEIAQEVFVRLFRSLDSIRSGADVGPWLRTVTSNLAADALRHRRRFAGHVPIDSLTPADEPRAAVGADERVRLEETRRLVWSALSELPPKRRDVVILRFVAGWSYDEIGDAIGCAPGTVASRLHRALRDLGRLLEGGTPDNHIRGGTPPGAESGGGR